MGVSDEVVHKAAEGGENLSEYVAQRELSGQQCDGELLWTLKSKRFTMGVCVYHSYEELKTAIEEYIVYYNEYRH